MSVYWKIKRRAAYVGNGCGGHPGGLRDPAEAPQAAQALAAPVTVKHQLGSTTVANVPRKVAVLDMNEADFLDQLGVPIAGMTKDYVPHFIQIQGRARRAGTWAPSCSLTGTRARSTT